MQRDLLDTRTIPLIKKKKEFAEERLCDPIMVKYMVFLLSVIFFWGCEHKAVNGTNIRPQDFPAFLKAPENATDILYATPQTAIIIEGAYSLSYFIDEEFPPIMTMQFVHNQLYAAGFFPTKYSLYNLSMEMGYTWESKELLEPGYVRLGWGEGWLNRSNLESVSVSFLYRYRTESPDMSKPHINILFTTEEAETSAFVKKYKKYYPKEDWEKDITEIDYDKIWKWK